MKNNKNNKKSYLIKQFKIIIMKFYRLKNKYNSFKIYLMN